jgi:nitrogen fixation protein NifU and related proteins
VRSGDVPDDPRFASLRALAGVHEYRSRLRCATLAWSALEEAIR